MAKPKFETYMSNPIQATNESLRRLFATNTLPTLQLAGLTLLVTVGFIANLSFIVQLDQINALIGLTILCLSFGLFCVAATIAQIHILLDSMNNKHSKLVPALRVGFVKAVPFVFLIMVYVLLVTGGLLLLIIPGFYIAARLGFAQFILVHHKKTVLQAFRESAAHTKGRVWEILGAIAVPNLVSSLATFIILWGAFKLALTSIDLNTLAGSLVGLSILLLIIIFLSGLAGYAVWAFRYHQIVQANIAKEDQQPMHNANYAVSFLCLLALFLPAPIEKEQRQQLQERYPILKPIFESVEKNSQQ